MLNVVRNGTERHTLAFRHSEWQLKRGVLKVSIIYGTLPYFSLSAINPSFRFCCYALSHLRIDSCKIGHQCLLFMDWLTLTQALA